MQLIPDDALPITTVYQEAALEPYEGKLAVAEVIVRRTDARYASDGTYAGTCLWPVQFSGWNAKDPVRLKSIKLKVTDPGVLDCIKAWDEAKTRKTNVSKGALLYFNPKAVDKTPEWAAPEKSTHVVTINNHQFYVPKV